MVVKKVDMVKLYWLIKCFFGFGSIKDGSTCWFSKKFFDVHDYIKTKGGDGIPTHFYKYTCPKCKTKFSI